MCTQAIHCGLAMRPDRSGARGSSCVVLSDVETSLELMNVEMSELGVHNSVSCRALFFFG